MYWRLHSLPKSTQNIIRSTIYYECGTDGRVDITMLQGLTNWDNWIRSSRLNILLPFVKYCTVGLLNTGCSYIVYSALIFFGIASSVSLAVGYVVGMASSYFLNAVWTFQKKSWSIQQIGRFILINIIILYLSELSLAWLLGHVTHSAYAGQAINLIPITLFGFLANRFVVFKDTRNGSQEAVHQLPLRTKIRFFLLAIGFVILQRLIVLISALPVSGDLHEHWPWYSLWIQGYTHWDSSWYIDIAMSGFTTPIRTAFWPVYPWLMSQVHNLTGITYAGSGILISLCSFIVAVYFIGRLAEIHFGISTAIMTMALFALMPTSFYYDAPYTEALFMALSIAAVYASSMNRFFTAGILAASATLTRNTGIILCVILLFDYIRWRRIGLKFWRLRWWKGLNRGFVWLALPVAALIAYCSWLYVKFGNPFAFLTAEAHWHRLFMPAWETYARTWNLLLDKHGVISFHSYYAFEIGSFTMAILLALIGLRYIRRSLTMWGWFLYILAVTWIASTEPSMNLPDYLVSFPRYLLMLFPGLIFLADTVKSKWLRMAILALFVFFLYQKSSLFYLDRWIA
jgi:putative flippase GtrA